MTAEFDLFVGAQRTPERRGPCWDSFLSETVAMAKTAFKPDMTMDEIMRRWPASIPFILAHGMLCIGCPIAVFHTAYDACEEHGIGEDAFLEGLLAIAGKG